MLNFCYHRYWQPKTFAHPIGRKESNQGFFRLRNSRRNTGTIMDIVQCNWKNEGCKRFEKSTCTVHVEQFSQGVEWAWPIAGITESSGFAVRWKSDNRRTWGQYLANLWSLLHTHIHILHTICNLNVLIDDLSAVHFEFRMHLGCIDRYVLKRYSSIMMVWSVC